MASILANYTRQVPSYSLCHLKKCKEPWSQRFFGGDASYEKHITLHFGATPCLASLTTLCSQVATQKFAGDYPVKPKILFFILFLFRVQSEEDK